MDCDFYITDSGALVISNGNYYIKTHHKLCHRDRRALVFLEKIYLDEDAEYEVDGLDNIKLTIIYDISGLMFVKILDNLIMFGFPNVDTLAPALCTLWESKYLPTTREFE